MQRGKHALCLGEVSKSITKEEMIEWRSDDGRGVCQEARVKVGHSPQPEGVEKSMAGSILLPFPLSVLGVHWVSLGVFTPGPSFSNSRTELRPSQLPLCLHVVSSAWRLQVPGFVTGSQEHAPRELGKNWVTFRT